MHFFHIVTVLLGLIICTSNASQLELVNDDELLNLIRTEKYVVVLFCKHNILLQPHSMHE